MNRNILDLVASYFQNLFSYLCSDMKRVQYKEFKFVKPPWYDSECRTERDKFLNLFVETGYQYFLKSSEHSAINLSTQRELKPKRIKIRCVNI